MIAGFIGVLLIAVVLILVMVLGNNQTLKSLFRSVAGKLFGRGKDGETKTGEVISRE